MMRIFKKHSKPQVKVRPWASFYKSNKKLVKKLKSLLPKQLMLFEMIGLEYFYRDYSGLILYVIDENGMEYVLREDIFIYSPFHKKKSKTGLKIIEKVNLSIKVYKRNEILGQLLCSKHNPELLQQSKPKRKKIKPSLRFDVFMRDNYRCCICGTSAKEDVTLEIDHIIPVSKGGTNDIKNLQVLCSVCNSGKSNKLI